MPGRITETVAHLREKPEIPCSILGSAHTLLEIDNLVFLRYGHFPPSTD